MTFRRRLTLFFLLIVVLPMIAVAVLVVQIADDSETGKADARLAAGMETALALYNDELDEAGRAARAAPVVAVGRALRSGDADRVRGAARRAVDRLGLASLAAFDRVGEPVARVGTPDGVARAGREVRRIRPEGPGTLIGTVRISPVEAQAFVGRVRQLTGRDGAILRGDEVVEATLDLPGGTSISDRSGGRDAEVNGEEVRTLSAALAGAGPDARLALLGPIETGGFVPTEPAVAAALAAFFALALLFIVVLLRGLQGQVADMLGAARRIGSGDFSRRLPVEGGDEMAGLASEFNQMSDRLSSQMSELLHQREELERSVRRIGEAFAAGLDRTALLEILTETTLAACEADHGRIILSGHDDVEAEAGPSPGPEMEESLREAEASALARRAGGGASRGRSHALAHPLTRPGAGDRVLGIMAIAREGAPFSRSQREVLRYLIGQAAASIENIGLHELVAEQAVTDPLTGLSNSRRFREWIDREAARAQRFGHQLSLVILDVDDFKQVNDTFGHLQGDEVLRSMAEILRLESRGVDEPARYGGEEFVVGLPETGTQGSLEVAERIRSRIEATEVPGVGGRAPIRVTASLGVAVLPDSASDVRGLIAAADEALYRAKRAGKDRVEHASPGIDPERAVARGGQDLP